MYSGDAPIYVSIERVLDARDQCVAMCLALCHPRKPTIRARVTNDVARLIGEGWVLRPARRFLVTTTGNSGSATMVSIGHTLGIISTVESQEWPMCHTIMSWPCPSGSGSSAGLLVFQCDSNGHHLRVVDATSPSIPRVTLHTMRKRPIKVWSNHKWALVWGFDALYLLRVPQPCCGGGECNSAAGASVSSKEIFGGPTFKAVMERSDFVFSHTEPDLIGLGDEASMLTSDCNGMVVMTLDLAKSFAESSRVWPFLTCSWMELGTKGC
ncbi:hypothetical protein Pelo_19243 [Pelomyxa schiedti]|nr:hypothetical protein Pelo_19243 [Pelomyxa schiedti]